MPGEKTYVQTLLVARNTEQSIESIETPAKYYKRTISEVSDASEESFDHSSLQKDLTEIKDCLGKMATKEDIKGIVKMSELEEIITKTVEKSIQELQSRMEKEFKEQLNSKTSKLQEQMDSLTLENEHQREIISKQRQEITQMKTHAKENDQLIHEAIRGNNYNEQYSRKSNIKMINFPEEKNENLREKFIELSKKELRVEITNEDIMAIHRLPANKQQNHRPVIIKMKNYETKTNIMRQRKNTKGQVRLLDDITKRNATLLFNIRSSNLHGFTTVASGPKHSRIKESR